MMTDESLIDLIVNRDTPLLERRIVDHDILGNPIYADDVQRWSEAMSDDIIEALKLDGRWPTEEGE